jgi:hypothetical protein
MPLGLVFTRCLDPVPFARRDLTLRAALSVNSLCYRTGADASWCRAASPPKGQFPNGLI